jgi:hypothetical protein
MKKKSEAMKMKSFPQKPWQFIPDPDARVPVGQCCHFPSLLERTKYSCI